MRNLEKDDPEVASLVRSEEARVEALVRWCWEGPAMSIDRGIEVLRERPEGKFETFSVIR